MFYVSFAGLDVGLGLERAGLGLGLGLGTAGIGLGLDPVTAGLGYNTKFDIALNMGRIAAADKTIMQILRD